MNGHLHSSAPGGHSGQPTRTTTMPPTASRRSRRRSASQRGRLVFDVVFRGLDMVTSQMSSCTNRACSVRSGRPSTSNPRGRCSSAALGKTPAKAHRPPRRRPGIGSRSAWAAASPPPQSPRSAPPQRRSRRRWGLPRLAEQPSGTRAIVAQPRSPRERRGRRRGNLIAQKQSDPLGSVNGSVKPRRAGPGYPRARR